MGFSPLMPCELLTWHMCRRDFMLQIVWPCRKRNGDISSSPLTSGWTIQSNYDPGTTKEKRLPSWSRGSTKYAITTATMAAKHATMVKAKTESRI